METHNPKANKFRRAWFLVLFLAPAIAYFWPMVLVELSGLSVPWEFWSQAPAGAERMLGSIVTYAHDGSIRNSLWPVYVRTQEGQLYQRFVDDNDEELWRPPTPEDQHPRYERQPWEPPPAPRPFIPFVLNPPPGQVVDTLKGETTVGNPASALSSTTDRYFVLLPDGSIWTWDDPNDGLIEHIIQVISRIHAVPTFIVAVVVVWWLDRADGRPRIWRRGFTTALNTALGIGLFTLLCVILPVLLALAGIVVLRLLGDALSFVMGM